MPLRRLRPGQPIGLSARGRGQPGAFDGLPAGSATREVEPAIRRLGNGIFLVNSMPQDPSDSPSEESADRQSGDSAERSPDPVSAKKSRGSLVRVVVWGTLAVVVLLGASDMRLKRAAEGTRDAWLKAKADENSRNKDLRQSQLAAHVQGSPTVSTAPTKKHRLAVSVTTYVWDGFFRDYQIDVYLGLGKDPSVEIIDGPGRAADAE